VLLLSKFNVTFPSLRRNSDGEEAAVTTCTKQSHEELKSDPLRWATEVDPIGQIDAGDGAVLVLGNCRRCQSTLAIERVAVKAARAG
jgi:hypothetical protein